MIVCDTTAINYLVQIGYTDLIPRLFGRAILPDTVVTELTHPQAPTVVRDWATQLPSWVSVQMVPDTNLRPSYGLHAGEAAALALALHHKAEFFYTDDRRARAIADSLGFATITTILVLDAAADRGWLDFNEVLSSLLQTNFRISPALIVPLREKHRKP